MENPLISVVIPVYNVEKYLKECLDSVIIQTLKDIEIICIDDGSNDNCGGILEEYAKKDSRFVVVHQENRGVSASRNLAMELANGEFVAFMDPDDFYPNDGVLKLLYDTAKKQNVLICGGSLRQYENGNVIDSFHGIWSKQQFAQHGYIDFKDYQFCYGYYRFIYNRTFIRSNNIVFPHYRRGQDLPFMAEAMLGAGTFYAIPDFVYCYRKGHQDSVMDYSLDKLKDALRTCFDILSISRRYGLSEMHLMQVRNIESKVFLEPIMNALLNGDNELLYLLIKINGSIDVKLLNIVNEDVYVLKCFKELFSSYKNEKLIVNSLSFKLLKIITYLPRKVKYYLNIIRN